MAEEDTRPKFTCKIELEFRAPDIADAYGQIANLLKSIEDPGVIKTVEMNPQRPPRPGHVPGCRAADGRRGICTCGPYPK